MPAPLVSVVLPFHDEERFLGEAIDSVRAQTLDDWELLLCDDGSTDASPGLAAEYARRDPRVRCLAHPGRANRGPSAARNLGCREARGRYLALLDGDDVWLPRHLECNVAILERHPEAAMVCSASEYWSSWADDPGDFGPDVVIPVGARASFDGGRWHVEPPPAHLSDSLVPPPGLSTALYPLGPGASPAVNSLVVRSGAVAAVGAFEEHFTGDRQFYEDQAFKAKVYLRSPVYVSSACLNRYRMHPQSAVQTAHARGVYHDTRRYFLDWFAGYLDREGVDDPGIAGALAAARIATLEALVDRRDAELAAAAAREAASREELAAAVARDAASRDELAAVVDAFHRSTSWRLTAPVRVAGAAVRRLRERRA